MANRNNFWSNSNFNYRANSNFSRRSSSSSSSSNGASEAVRASLSRMYKCVDGKNKLKGHLFSKLIRDTNEIINKANTTKQNTKI